MLKIIPFLSLVLLSFFSCAQEKKKVVKQENPLLLKEIITKNENNKEIYTLKVDYSGNKINYDIDYKGNRRNYYYIGDRISRIESTNANHEVTSTILFEYDKEKLLSQTQKKYGLDYPFEEKIEYTHLNKENVLYRKFEIWEGKENKVNEKGKYTFKNGNIVKSKQILREYEMSIDYQFDDKNNAWKNILGANLIYDFSPFKNNITKRIDTIKTIGGIKVITIKNNYNYNSRDYPETAKSIDFFNSEEVGSFTTEYKY